MGEVLVTLKNIYQILRTRDYPVYSHGVMEQWQWKGMTLVKFWKQIFLYRWRNTEHGAMIWRTQGSKNRYHSELCNRKSEFPFYEEYTKELLEKLTDPVFLLASGERG